MRTIVEVDKVNLTLTPMEVNWLKERMQNCAEKFPQDEPENDKLMRENFFKHLPYM